MTMLDAYREEGEGDNHQSILNCPARHIKLQYFLCSHKPELAAKADDFSDAPEKYVTVWDDRLIGKLRTR